jgi:hypothetical protein
MISIETPGIGQHRFRQTLYAPAVYFDHWALRRFSERRELADRLVAALHAKHGTLLVSTQNFAEFAAIEDPQHARDAEAFLDRCLPHLYFADFATDPGFMLVHGKPPDAVDAPEDNWLAVALFDLWRINGEKLTTADLFLTDEAHRAVVLDAFRDMKSSVAAMVHAIKKDEKRLAFARSGKRQPGATLRDLLLQELLRDFLLDPSAQFGENDASDFAHALGSTLACDMVLLDGRWAHKVWQAGKRLKKAGVTHRLPPAYAERELPAFLAALEAWPLFDGPPVAKPIPT